MKLLESDIHFGKSNNSQIKNQDCLDFIKFTCDYVKEHKEVDEIIFLGDWFDNRDSINVSTLYYSSKALDLPYYRELNTRNQYKLITTNFYTYYADMLSETDKEFVDISYNANIIRLFYKIFMKEYFRQAKRPH